MKSSIRQASGHFKASDGLHLFYRCWRPKKTRAVLVFIHGMAEHIGRYQYPVDYFSRRGYGVYAMDLRGHGDSGGRRVYAESFDRLLEDIRSFVQTVSKKEPGKKIFLVGHSFGGQLVLNVASRFPKDLSGVLVSSPNIRLKMPVPLLKLLLAPVLSRLLPKLALDNEIDPSFVSHDPEVVEAYRTDRKVSKKVTARLAHMILENQRHLLETAGKIRTPCLLMHAGDDRICSPEATSDFFEAILMKDKTLKIYPGYSHELFNEVGRERVFQDMEAWIEKRM